MATYSSILVWEIPWTEDPGELWSMGSQTVGHDLGIKNLKVLKGWTMPKSPLDIICHPEVSKIFLFCFKDFACNLLREFFPSYKSVHILFRFPLIFQNKMYLFQEACPD